MAELASSTTPWPEGLMKNYRWLDECLMKLPSTEKEFQPAWQAYKYMLRNKMYAFIGVNDTNGRPLITLKLDPGYSAMMRQEYEDIVAGYYMNKVHWSSVYLDGAVPRETLASMVGASYETLLLSLSKKAQREIKGM